MSAIHDGLRKEMLLNAEYNNATQIEMLREFKERLDESAEKEAEKYMVMMINDKYKCGNCDQVSSAEAINATTLNDCINRKQRRAYVPIEKTKQTDRKWYRCPICTSIVSRYKWKEHNECPGLARFINVSCNGEGLNINIGGK